MSRYGSATITGPASVITRVIEGSTPDSLQAGTDAAIAALPVGYVIIDITLAGSGHGRRWTVTIEAAAPADVIGGFAAPPSVSFYIGVNVPSVLAARALVAPVSGTLADSQIAGASNGDLYMGMLVQGELAGEPMLDLGAISLWNATSIPLPLATLVPLTWSTQRFIDPTEFSHTPGTSDVTLIKGGRYAIGFNVTPTITAGTGIAARSTVLHALLADVGAGFVFVPGTIVASYHRIDTNGTQTATLAPIELVLPAAALLRVVSFKTVGASTIATLGSGNSFTVERSA